MAIGTRCGGGNRGGRRGRCGLAGNVAGGAAGHLPQAPLQPDLGAAIGGERRCPDPPRGRVLPPLASPAELGVLGPAFAGVLVSDFSAAYDHDAGPHQRCWAHLLRDIRELRDKHPKDAPLQVWADHGAKAQIANVCDPNYTIVAIMPKALLPPGTCDG